MAFLNEVTVLKVVLGLVKVKLLNFSFPWVDRRCLHRVVTRRLLVHIHLDRPSRRPSWTHFYANITELPTLGRLGYYFSHIKRRVMLVNLFFLAHSPKVLDFVSSSWLYVCSLFFALDLSIVYVYVDVGFCLYVLWIFLFDWVEIIKMIWDFQTSFWKLHL
jgi:hypothetical protein